MCVGLAKSSQTDIYDTYWGILPPTGTTTLNHDSVILKEESMQSSYIHALSYFTDQQTVGIQRQDAVQFLNVHNTNSVVMIANCTMALATNVQSLIFIKSKSYIQHSLCPTSGIFELVLLMIIQQLKEWVHRCFSHFATYSWCLMPGHSTMIPVTNSLTS